MVKRNATLDVITSSHRFNGEYNLPGTGVLGVLGDTLTTFIELRQAKMGRLQTADNLSQQAPVIRVIKHQIAAICLNRREDMGQITAARAYARVIKYPLRVSTQLFELEGTFEWAGMFDLSVMMATQGSDFIPLFDASLGGVIFPNLLIQAPVIIFNRSFMNSVVVMNEGL